MESLYLPIIFSLIYFGFFSFLLKNRLSEKNLFCELGFLYSILLLLYTVLPGLIFIYGTNRPGDPISVITDMISINAVDLSRHLWRQILFMVAFSIGYLYLRGKEKFKFCDYEIENSLTIYTLIIIILSCLIFLSIMSKSVDSYLDNYVRFENLSAPFRKIASILFRLKNGFYSILITLLFLQYKKFKLLIPLVILLICLYELIFSHGSRIIVLIILTQTFFLYNYIVKIINVKKFLLYVFLLMIIFSAIEVIRLLDPNLTEAKDNLSNTGISAPGELGSVFITGFHLYTERLSGTLPNKPWQMFFFDFISPFTFNSFTDWNPQYWYAENYFPNAVVPPFTIGPIAESAIWGGEIDLFFRGLINGLFFAIIVRLFLKNKYKLWAIVGYGYIFSNCIITLKYSVFFYLTPIVKDLLPTLIILGGLRYLYKQKFSTIQIHNK